MAEGPPTRNRWVPISCHDAANLERRRTGFYLDSHRIEFVFMAGWIEQQRFPTQPVYILNDRTGQTAQVSLPGHDPKSMIAGKFIKLYARRGHRDLVAHKWQLQDRIPFEEEIGLYYEASRIRDNLIMGELDQIRQDTTVQRWISEYQFPSFDPTQQPDDGPSLEPHGPGTEESVPTLPTESLQRYQIVHPPLSQLLSLSRGVVLARHPSFRAIPAITSAGSTKDEYITNTNSCETLRD